MSNIIWNRGIEGVVIAPLMERLSSSAPRTVELEWNRFASVEISETITSPELHRSLHDQYTSMVRLLDERVKLDYATMSGIGQNSRRVGAAAIHRGQRGVPAKPVRTEVEGALALSKKAEVQAYNLRDNAGARTAYANAVKLNADLQREVDGHLARMN